MNRFDWLAILTVVGAIASLAGVALTALLSRGAGGPYFPTGPPASRPLLVRPQLAMTVLVGIALTGGLLLARGGTRCQTLIVASSQEKFEMLSGLAKSYNDRGGYAGTGLNPVCTTVKVDQVYSGDAEAALENGWSLQLGGRPDVWAPASSAWVRLLLAKAPGQQSLIPPDYFRKSLFSSPLVIAMPQPMARALGPAIGWQDIAALAADPNGWGSKGYPEWGPFHLGKTNPHISTSGLLSLVGSYHAIHADESPASVTTPQATAFAGGIEQSVIHYGSTATDFLRNLQDVDSHSSADPTHLAVLKYVSAIAIEEKEVVDYNLGMSKKVVDNQGRVVKTRFPPPYVKLVPIYPKEGTSTADHPYVILDWPGQPSGTKAAARDFYDYLTAPARRTVADQNGFRQQDGAVGPWLKQQLGIVAQPPQLVEFPGGNVLAAEISAWDHQRKPASVMILIDRGSDRAALDGAISHLRDALGGFQPQDRVMVAAYPAKPESSGPYLVVADFAPADPPHLPLLKQAVTVPPLVSGTTTPNTLAASLEAATGWMGSTYAVGSINAILVVEMSPGAAGQPGDSQLLDHLRAQPPSAFVHIFAIGPSGAVGPDNGGRLSQITIAGGGASYSPDAASHFLTDAISNF